MKRIGFLLVSIFFTTLVFPQGTKPQRVYRVTVTRDNVVKEGELTGQINAVNQEIYDSLGRLHTEIDYDPATSYPNNFRWHYYDSMLLVRSEVFVNERLDRRVAFEYRPDKLVSAEHHFKIDGRDTLLYRTALFSYNSKGLLTKAVFLSDTGRRLFRVRSSFDSHGTELRRRVGGNRGEPEDGISRLDRIAEYDSPGLMRSETVRLRMTDRSRSLYTVKYKYDESGNMTEQARYDGGGKLQHRTEYEWQQDRNRITLIKLFNGSDKLVKHLTKSYEIYMSTDRRQRIIDY
jgi:YD repeat-containing protein